MNEGKSSHSFKSSVYPDVPMSARSSRATIVSVAASKQTIIRDAVELHTMPEVISEEILEEKIDDTIESVKSTEEICNQEECFTFKSIQNPRIHQAYYSQKDEQFEEVPGKDTYLRMVKQVKIAPVSRIVDSLSTSSIDLQYYGLDSKQFKPLAEVLMNNTSVKELNLKGNTLSVDALYHLGQMLRKNGTIRKLNLQHCNIGPEGAEMLGNGLEICENLNDLDLSYNNLGDEGLEILGIKLGYNISIRNLNLSHNNLTHKSGIFLAEAMEENVNIKNLDLSWNLIAEEQGLKKFLYTTAEHNEGLLKLNLSWNTLGGDKIANIIKNFISQHRTLRELDLSHNKFETESDNIKIAKGINLAESLKELNLSYNGITADTAFAMLSSINGNKAKLQTLRMDNVWVKPEFHKMSQELQSQNGMRVIVQGVIGGVDIKGPDMQTLLLKRAHFLGYKPKSKKNKKDFGWFLLRLQNAGTLAPVKKAKFEKLIIEDNIKFDDGMIDEFAKKFRNESKRVDLNLMLEKYLLLFPDTALPKPKEKKKPKSPKDGKLSPKKDKLSVSSKKSGKGSSKASLPKSTEEEKTSLPKSTEEEKTSLPKSTEEEKTSLPKPSEEENVMPSEDVRGSKTISFKDQKRESYQSEGGNIDGFRTSLNVDGSPKRVSFMIGDVEEQGAHLEDPLMKTIDETEDNTTKEEATTEPNIVKEDATTESNIVKEDVITEPNIVKEDTQTEPNIAKEDAPTEDGVQETLEATTDNENVIEMSTPANTSEPENAVVDENVIVSDQTTTKPEDNNTPNENEDNIENVSTTAKEELIP